MRRLIADNGRLFAHLFELAVAASWTLIGLAYLLDPGIAERSPVGRNVAPLDTVWSLAYIVGGPLAIYALLRGLRQWRVAGLVLLTAGLIMQGFAAATFDAEPRVAVYFVYAVACGIRAGTVARCVLRERA